MRHLDEYRDPSLVQEYLRKIHAITTREWSIMEICGGQTHSIVKYGLEEMLPTGIRIIHGPGCPVCVTPLEMIEKAITLASTPGITFTSFGDMLRVPGSERDLLSVKARGGDVRTVYSPLDALRIAKENPSREVVFFAIGFETTAPANAMLVREARRQRVENISILCSQVLVPPAIRALLSSPDSIVQGILAAGHVCTVMGYREYVPMANEFSVPIVVTGFEPVDLVYGMYCAIRQLESGTAHVENAYSRVVTEAGNMLAQKHIAEVFRVCDRTWRGIGEIPQSGLTLRDEFAMYDAEKKFGLGTIAVCEPEECIAGRILQGHKRPVECPAFGSLCTPERPLGAPMVSSEGVCAAYFRYNLPLAPSFVRRGISER